MERKGPGMTGISPVVEELQDCTNDAERARWLLKIPVVMLYREQTAIYPFAQAANSQSIILLTSEGGMPMTAPRPNKSEKTILSLSSFPRPEPFPGLLPPAL